MVRPGGSGHSHHLSLSELQPNRCVSALIYLFSEPPFSSLAHILNLRHIALLVNIYLRLSLLFGKK